MKSIYSPKNSHSYFEFSCPVKVLAGEMALENIPHELSILGVKRPFIVTESALHRLGLVELVTKNFAEYSLQIGGLFTRVPPDSSNEIVEEAATQFRQNGCDGLIAIGGGSVMDTAKGVNMVVSEGRSLLELAGAEILRKNLRPLLAVPTTSGTGSEATAVTVISHLQRQTKMAFTSYQLIPHVAVLDPRMTLSLPPFLTAATGMDALTHAVEGLTCLQSNPVSAAFLHSALNLIRDNLFQVLEDGGNPHYRLNMALASFLAGMGFSNSMVGVVHSIGHALGAVAHVHHGTAMGLLLPFCMEYNFDVLQDDYAQLLLPLAGSEVFAQTPPAERGRKTIQVIHGIKGKLKSLCQLPERLRELGVKKEQFPIITEKALEDGSILFNPKEVDRQDVMAILNESY